METFPNKKLNPYLYPFKKKPYIPHLYSSKTKFPMENPLYQTEQLLQIGMINEIVTNTVFQPSMTQILNTEKETNKDSSFQTKTNLAVCNTMISERSPVFDMPKTNFERRNIAALTSERLKPVNIPQDASKPCTGFASTDAALKIPMVASLSLEPNLTMPGASLRPMYAAFQKPVIGLDRPNAIYLDFERSHTRETPSPKEINWTRMDLAQRKLDMIPTWTKVAMGVVCGTIASTVVHPLDVVKVRLQLFPKQMTTICLFERILACEGPSGLYAGLTAGILRQLTYTGTRLVVYHSLYAHYKNTYGKYPDFRDRLGIAVVAGLSGAFMGVPSEVALVRMIEVRRLRRSPCSPRCSKACRKVHHPENALRQLLRIARREGLATWWRGAVPTLVRSVFVTTAQVGVYSEIRQRFTMGDFVFTGPYIHFYVAGISSIFSAVLSLPVDQVKTRYQSYQERHRPATDILKDMLRKKGVKYLWKGFLPYYARQAIHTMISYVVLDQLIDAYVEFHDATKSNT